MNRINLMRFNISPPRNKKKYHKLNERKKEIKEMINESSTSKFKVFQETMQPEAVEQSSARKLKNKKRPLK